MTAEPQDRRPPSLIVAGLVMLALSLLLVWLPVAGPLIAGWAGGRMAGSPVRGIALALVPAVVVGLVIVLALGAFDLPVLGAVAGVGVALVVLVQDVPLLVGAAIGGATAS
jgi:hypothetical protein